MRTVNATVASFRPKVVAQKWSPRRMIVVVFWISVGLWLLLGNVARAIWLAVS